MSSQQLAVLEDLCGWRSVGHRAVLLTVCRTWSSSPSAPGSLCAIREDGRLSGSVSGGRIEDELIDRVRSGVYWDRPARMLCYVGDDSDPGQRLPAGASLALALEPSPDPEEILAALEALRERNVLCRELDLDTGTVVTRRVEGTTRGAVSVQGRRVRNLLRPGWRVLPVGAAGLVQSIVQLARFVHFDVVDFPLPSGGEPLSGQAARLLSDSIGLTGLDPLTVVLMLGDVPAGIGQAIATAAGCVGAYRCVLAKAGHGHDLGPGADTTSLTVCSSGDIPEEIAVSVFSALIELRARHLKSGDNPEAIRVLSRGDFHGPASVSATT
ncbi:XdhC family protein [Cupriavidus basilensis]|uniref:XdhC family protein n=1 Tax=Cupriavidus basilensis TaxID=68895 RepID=UPI0020A684EF|nr:XdhC family protein [Cupriavidus basilensis]MCP3024065.1 hypothetical protein [Cupriavidus basilensis]